MVLGRILHCVVLLLPLPGCIDLRCLAKVWAPRESSSVEALARARLESSIASVELLELLSYTMSSLLLLPSMSFSYALLLLLPLSMDGANFQIPGSKGFVIKMIPFLLFFLPKIGPKGVWSRGPPPHNLFWLSTKLCQSSSSCNVEFTNMKTLSYRHFCFLGWELWCTTLPSRQKYEILLVALFQTKKWIFEPIELICCSYCWCRCRCQWISSWLQLGYHFRTKKASANSRFHHRHLCNNTRSKNPSFCSCIHLKKMYCDGSKSTTTKQKKNLLQKLPAAKNLFLNTLIYWRLQKNPLL